MPIIKLYLSKQQKIMMLLKTQFNKWNQSMQKMTKKLTSKDIYLDLDIITNLKKIK